MDEEKLNNQQEMENPVAEKPTEAKPVTEEKPVESSNEESVAEESNGVVEPEKVKEQLTKKINYAAALKEKNRRIQELKAQLEALKAQQEAVKEETNDVDELFNLESDESDVKKELEALKSELNMLKQEREREREQKQLQQARSQLDRTIDSLKAKYPDFDESKVLGEVFRRKGEYATLQDLELVYKAMKAEELLQSQNVKNAVTEGGSAGQPVTKKKYKTFKEAVEDILGKPLE